MPRGFRELEVYRRAAELANALRASVEVWPSMDRWTAGVQAIRSADSIGANIAEAWGRWTYPDRLRCLSIARGSACELQHWLDAAVARNLDLPPDALAEADEI